MRVSCAKLTCGDSLGGGATVATFLGGTEGDCVLLCCSTAAWFTYGVCIIGGESEALGFHQETTEESRKQQDQFCIKTLHYLFMRLHS